MENHSDDKDSDDISEALTALGWEEEKGHDKMEPGNDEKDKEIAKLRDTVKELQESNEKANGKAVSLEQQLHLAEQNFQNQLSNQARLEKRVEELNLDLGRRGLDLQKFQTKIAQLESDLATSVQGKSTKDDLTKEIEQKTNKIVEMENNITDLQQNVQNLQEQIEQKNEGLADYSRKIANLEESLNSQKTQVEQSNQYRIETEKLGHTLQDTQEKCKTLETQLQDAQSQVKRYKDDIEVLSKNKTDSTRLTQLEQVITKKDEVIHLKEDEIADLERSIEKTEQNLTQLKHDLETKQEKITNLERELNDQKSANQKQILALQQSLKEKEDSQAAKADELTRVSMEREGLFVNLAEHTNKIQVLEKQVAELKSENQGLKNSVDKSAGDYRDKLQLMEAQLSQKEARIAELREAIDITMREAENLKQKVPSVKFLKDKSDQLEISIQQRDEKITLLEDRVHLKEEVVESLKRENEIMKKTAELKENELQAFNQKIKTLETDTANLREKFQTGEQESIRQKKDAEKQLVSAKEERAKWKDKFDESEAVQEKLLDEIQKLKDQGRKFEEQLKSKDAAEIELKKKIKLLRRDLEKQKT